jgi:hypothetical protein
MKPELLVGTPPGNTATCYPSGWIHLHIFTQWLQHFIKVLKPCMDDPVILILDGKFSHTRNPDIIEMRRHHGVISVSLPPHSTHKLQPLDFSFMGPFKHYYSMEIKNWMKNHPYR